MTNRADALQAAFAGAPSARTDALRAIPLPPRPATPEPSNPDDREADQPVPPLSTPQHSGGPQPGRRQTKRRSRTSGPARQDPVAEQPDPDPASRVETTPYSTIVYVTSGIRDALRRRVARENRITFTDLVLDALEAHEKDLRDAWPPPLRSSGRFTRAPARRVRRDEPGVQLSLCLTPSNLAVLDEMVEQLGAPSRTALVEEALRRYFADELG